MRRLVFLFAGAALLAACSSSRPAIEAPATALPDAFPNHGAEQIRARVAEGLGALQGFRASGDIALTSPAQNGRFGMRLLAADPGNIYLTVRPGFGIEAARVLVRPDSFFVHNRIENTLTFGSMEDALTALPIPVTADEGFATITGTLLPPAGPGWTVSADSLLYYFRSDDGRQVVTVDPTLWRVVRTVAYDAAGSLEEERRFERFAVVDGVTLARRITINRPADKVQATLLYSEIGVNPAEAPPALLDVGPNTRRVHAGNP